MITTAPQIAIQRGFKVYPIIKKGKLYIEFSKYDKIIKTFDKPVSFKGCGEAMLKTYEFIVKKYNL